MSRRLFPTAQAALALAALAIPGCKSPHLDLTVANHTGAAIRLLEVDYPSASFGSDALAAGSTMQYRIHVQGDGPIKVQFIAEGGRQVTVSGPALTDRQQGNLNIDLLPGGRTEFRQ